MLPRLDRLSLRRAPRPTDAPKRKSTLDAAMDGNVMQRSRTNGGGGGAPNPGQPQPQAPQAPQAPQNAPAPGAGGSSSGAGGSSSAPTPDLGGLPTSQLHVRISDLNNRLARLRAEGASPDQIEQTGAELRRLRLEEDKRAEQRKVAAEDRAMAALARFQAAPRGPGRNGWCCRSAFDPDRPCRDPYLGYDEGLNGDNQDCRICRGCAAIVETAPSQDQLPNVGGDDLAAARAATQNEMNEQANVVRRQTALIELKDVYPELGESPRQTPSPEDVKLLKRANLRVSQAMIWIRLLSASNEDAKKLLGIELSANEVAAARDLLRGAIIQWVREGGTRPNQTVEDFGSALFWAIAIARELLARREKEEERFAFYKPATLMYDYTMQGIADFLWWYLEQAMLADESRVPATRTARGQQFAQRRVDRAVYRKPSWYSLGFNPHGRDGKKRNPRGPNKLKYLSRLLADAKMDPLHPTTMDHNSLPRVRTPFVSEREAKRRRLAAAAAEAAAEAAARAAAEEEAEGEEEAEAEEYEDEDEEEEEEEDEGEEEEEAAEDEEEDEDEDE